MAGRITFAGHATVLIEVAGTRLLTDPLLRNRFAHLRRRAAPVAPEVARWAPRGADLAPAPRSLRHGVAAGASRAWSDVMPRGGGSWHGVPGSATCGRSWAGDEIELGGVARAGRPGAPTTIAAGRDRRAADKAAPVGFVVDGGPASISRATRTCSTRWRSIDPLDVALLPIWGWGPTLGPGHMDPLGAASRL